MLSCHARSARGGLAPGALPTKDKVLHLLRATSPHHQTWRCPNAEGACAPQPSLLKLRRPRPLAYWRGRVTTLAPANEALRAGGGDPNVISLVGGIDTKQTRLPANGRQ